MKNKGHVITLVLLTILAAGSASMFSVKPAVGGTDNFQLFGSAFLGWGFTSGSITSPGPTMTVSQGDLVNLTLTSQDGGSHKFFVDYNANGLADPGEPTSTTFSATINFQFVASKFGNFTYHCAFHPSIMFGSFVVNPTHDVAVTDVKPSKTSLARGETIQINVNVTNLGGFNETFNVTLYRLGSTKLFTLNGSASTGWNSSTPGPTITVNQNDTVILTLTSTDALNHQFFVDYNGNSAPDPGEPASAIFSTITKFIFIADRAGTYNYHCAFHPGTMFGTFTVNPSFNTTIGVQQLVSSLTPGETRVITFSWNTTGIDYGKYTLIGAADLVAGDINATNNVFVGNRVTVSIPGDINGDYIVDIFDAILLSSAFNTTPNKPNWNPNADLKPDNIIDVFDAIVLSNHFAQTTF